MSDFTYRDNEWELHGALLCVDAELTLTVQLDPWSGKFAGLTLYSAFLIGCPLQCPHWLPVFMGQWVRENKAKLEAAYFGKRLYRDAAE